MKNPDLETLTLRCVRVVHENSNTNSCLVPMELTRQWIGPQFDELPISIRAFREKYDGVDFAAIGVSPHLAAKTRRGVIRAIAMSGLAPEVRMGRQHFIESPEWKSVSRCIGGAQAQKILRPFIVRCIRLNLAPHQVMEETVQNYLAYSYENSAVSDQRLLHRDLARHWNRTAQQVEGLPLATLHVPGLPGASGACNDLPEQLVADWQSFASVASDDPFSKDYRGLMLSPKTLTNMRGSVRAAYRAAVRNGVALDQITQLHNLVSIEIFAAIAEQLLSERRGEPSSTDVKTLQALVKIARHYVDAPAHEIEEMTDIIRTFPKRTQTLAPRNRKLLRRLEDPQVQKRFLQSPDRMIYDAMRPGVNEDIAIGAIQTAIGIKIELHTAIRIGDLRSLQIGVHIVATGPSAMRLVIPKPHKSKEKSLDFCLPIDVVADIKTYQDEIGPRIFGYRPDLLWDNGKRQARSVDVVRYLLQRYLKLYGGVEMHPNGFRPLAAKFLLDDRPGSYDDVQVLLGHKNTDTTLHYYAGLEAARAVRLHSDLMKEVRAELSDDHKKALGARR